MSSFTGQELADHLYYHRLPDLYGNADASETEKKDLYRYLQAVNQGAFNDTLEQIAALTSLVNPLTCPVEYLPYLYQSFGLPYFEDIGEYYNRRFLSSVGELLKRRGTIGGVRYLVRVLTGMESDITYERIRTETEHSRILNVYPIFPDITSLAEVEVTSYTIKRFLELYLPYYLRLTFFPAIETQYLEGNIYNGVSFANTLLMYLFNDRERVLEIPNTRENAFYYSGDITLKNVGETDSRKLDDDLLPYQKFEVNGKLVIPLNTRITSYDLTKLEGKKEPIGNWITHGDYIFRIPSNHLRLLEVVNSFTDLYKPKEERLQIDKFKATGFLSRTDNDLKFAERELPTTIQRVNDVIVDRNVSYDLTGLSGEKLLTPETIREKYSFSIDRPKEEVFNSVAIQDLTFIEGNDIIADYSDVYNHDYNFRKKISKMFAITGLKSYNLIQTSEHSCELGGNINFCVANFSIVEYDLRW